MSWLSLTFKLIQNCKAWRIGLNYLVIQVEAKALDKPDFALVVTTLVRTQLLGCVEWCWIGSVGVMPGQRRGYYNLNALAYLNESLAMGPVQTLHRSQEYRKVVYKSRRLCAIFNFWCGLYLSAAFIRGRLICNFRSLQHPKRSDTLKMKVTLDIAQVTKLFPM